MPDNDDPYDLERYWNRLRGPKPEPSPEPEVITTLGKDVWASMVRSRRGEPVSYVGPRIRGGVEKGQGVETTINCDFPPSEVEADIHGIALWTSETAIEPLAVTHLTNPGHIMPGDGVQISVSVVLPTT
jgi:hypothetical protein